MSNIHKCLWIGRLIMAKRVTHKNVGEAVANMEDFEGPSSRGGSRARVGSSTGRLPEEHVKEFEADDPSYVVKSYDTPVAWHGKGGWKVPGAKYSKTTSRLQGTLRRALFDQGHDNARDHKEEKLWNS